MSIQFKEEEKGKVLIIYASGKLTKADYEAFLPEVDRLIQLYGTLYILVDMSAFHGWEVDALWEDIKFGITHFADIKQMAIVGDKQWQKALALFAKPFNKATIRYFDHADITAAYQWLSEAQRNKTATLIPADRRVKTN